MALDAQDIRVLAADLSAPEAHERDMAASKVADWISPSMDKSLASALARIIEALMSLEDDETALQSQLNALSEVSSFGLVPRDVIARVISSRDWDYAWAPDFIDGLAEDAPYAPEEAPPHRQHGARLP